MIYAKFRLIQDVSSVCGIVAKFYQCVLSYHNFEWIKFQLIKDWNF